MTPIVIVGGWLGSGKTTYINSLLRRADGERLAVIVNDVGELNIDVDLIASHEGSTVELTNGCVCCTIGGSLAVTLKELVDGPQPPDRIIIEASGIADPLAVSKYGDRRRLRLEAVVVMVDVHTIERRLSDPRVAGQFQKQLAAADVLIPTKLDLGDVPGWRSLLEANSVGAVGEFRAETATWFPNGQVDVGAVVGVLRAAGLWRAKGFVSTTDGRWLIQAVGDVVSADPLTPAEVATSEYRKRYREVATSEMGDGIVLIDADAAAIAATKKALSTP